jgi:two-component system sensor histidine kinase/response regulator
MDLFTNMEMKVKARILIIEDDPETSNLLSRFFEMHYSVVRARTGEEALTLLARDEFDLVLLDIGLPGIDGFEVLRQVRSRFTSSDLPVILLSALNDTETVLTGLTLGANDYIAKPPEFAILQARMQTLLDLKRIHDQHKQVIRELTQAQQTQEKFFSIVSHDLRNPLNNIRTALFLLRDMHKEDPQSRQILDQADTTLNDMLGMIKTFLDVARLQSSASGRLDINITVVNVSDVIRNLAGQNRLIAGEKGITLIHDRIAGLVMGDVRFVSQAVGNLIDNAIKFSPRGSTVFIEVTSVEPGWKRITVTDSGPGVPEDERALLFEMFSKLTPRPTGSETSTGLGLWIVKQLTLLQGGRVGADFPADGGSMFWIDLPAYEPDADRA